MGKHWTEITEEVGHEVERFRYAFLKEHERADEILMSPEGIPLSATYLSHEMPGYGKTYTEVPAPKIAMKDVR